MDRLPLRVFPISSQVPKAAKKKRAYYGRAKGTTPSGLSLYGARVAPCWNPRTDRDTTPEENLLYAILERAILDLRIGSQLKDRISINANGWISIAAPESNNRVSGNSETQDTQAFLDRDRYYDYRNALSWLRSPVADSARGFTFASICDLLGIDASTLRARILSVLGIAP